MTLDVYDITTNYNLVRYEINLDTENDPICKINNASKEIPQTLIYSHISQNKAAYLQKYMHPSIDDIYIKGKISYKNCHLMSDLINSLNSQTSEAKEQYATKINDFFKYIKGERLYTENTTQEDQDIILIPDNFSPLTQEYLLSLPSFNRNTTTLLWRSVAACLGCDFKSMGLKEDDKILVLDFCKGNPVASILTLKNTKRNGKEALVPQRKAFIKKNKERPIHNTNIRNTIHLKFPMIF